MIPVIDGAGSSHHMDNPELDPRDDEVAGRVPSRWALLRRLGVFQIKLALDGPRDLLLSPISIVTVLWGMLANPAAPAAGFERLLRLGRRSDRWIDLFDTHGDDAAVQPADATDAAPDGTDVRDARMPANASALIDRVEAIVREEYARGGGMGGIEQRLRHLRRPGALAGTRPESIDDRSAREDNS